MSKLKKNLGLQTIYQIFATAIPLITSPYLSRVLGPDGLGIYSYTYSIVNYFVLFAMMGLTNYGSRTIAMAKSKQEEERLFCEIFTMQVCTTILALFVYAITLILFIRENRIVSIIQIFWILSCFLDVNWYFFGKEEFKTTVTRNIVIKILTVFSLFIFVRTSDDVWIYTFIMAFGTFLSQMILYIVIRTKIKYKIPSLKNVILHVKPNIILFIPILAMSVYHLMDKTMLGLMSEYSESGFYYNADKVINIPLGIIGGIGTVMLPKVSSLRADGRDGETRKLLGLSIDVFTCVAVALAFGIASISKEIVPFFFGTGYEKCVQLIIILSAVMIFKTLSNVIRSQYLIPYNREKVYIVAVVVGAAVNFIINYTLIGVKGMGAFGATIGTLVAEFVVCVAQYLTVEKDLHLVHDIIKTIPYILIGFAMFVVVRFVSSLSNQILIKMGIEILSGGIVYISLTIVYWIISRNPMIEQIKTKIK